MNKDELIQDRYRLEEPLGKGGMAEVWRAHDGRLQRSVAIKFLASQFTDDPEFLVRLFTEAQSIARIQDANVVSVLDFGEHGDCPYLVMEFVPGTLNDVVGDAMEVERAFSIVRDAARGAGAAHVLGIIHRDIKPGNILLTDYGRAKIADFGIARTSVAEKLTATGAVLGSPHYISPEQAAGKGARSESDVYALGVVLYELLTGKPPFDRDNATAVAVAHVEEEPVPPSESGADVGAEIDAFVMRCLAKDPEARFADGNELANAMEEIVPAIAGRNGVTGANGIAVAPAAATAAVAGEDTDEALVIDETGALPGRRRLVGVLAALAFLILATAGVWAVISRNAEPDRAIAGTEAKPDKRAPPSPKETFEEDEAVIGTTPTPTSDSTSKDEDPQVQGQRADRRGGTGGDDNWSPSPTPEDTTSPEPTPTPTPTPSE